MKRLVIALLVIALVACGQNPVASSQFHEPVSMAVFSGFTHAHPGTQAPYLAVANSRTDELRIIDLSSHSAVLSPGMAFPLSVPTDPFPLRVASASLGGTGPDLLVVASAGELALQVVTTWDATSGAVVVDPTRKVSLTTATVPGINPSATVLSLLGMKVPGASPAKARILIGLSGGQLVVADFVRSTNPADPPGAIALAPPLVLKPLGFDPVDLALDASGKDAQDFDTTHPLPIYVATPDVINGSDGFSAQGVAMISTTATPSDTWTIKALKAGPAGTGGKATTLVAATWVGERGAGNSDALGTRTKRVYAALDPSGCGQDREISCGIVTLDPGLDPTTGLMTSLAQEDGFVPAPSGVPLQPFRAPFVLPVSPAALPVTVTSLAIAMPAASGGQTCVSPYSACSPATAADGMPLMLLAPGSGQRWTTAAMVVGASDGNSYVIDLGRMAAADDVSLLSDPTGTKVTSLLVSTPAGSAQLGLWTDVTAPGASQLATDATTMLANFVVTPGYTRDDTWTVIYRGALPGLTSRAAELSGGGTTLKLAGQGNFGLIDDPALGVQQGDIVQVVTVDASQCPLNGSGEATVAAPPSGGALQLNAAPCLMVSGVTTVPVIINVLAHDLVAFGTATGYIGRPLISTTAGQNTFQFAWTFPEDVITRKARRFYYPAESACAVRSGGCPLFPAMTDPLATGPTLQFRLGSTDGSLQRGASITFTTQSGVQAMARIPSSVSIPSAAISFDRTLLTALNSAAVNDGTVFYVTYLGDTLFEFPPGQSAAAVLTLR